MREKINQSHINQPFFEDLEEDITLLSFGYDDFKQVKPMKYPHFKQSDSIHYVFEGSGVLHVQGERFEVNEKQFFFVPKGVPVYYYPKDGDEWAYAWFNFGGEKKDELVKRMGFSSSSPVKEADGNFSESHIYALIRELDKVGKIGYFATKSVFYNIIDGFMPREKRLNFTEKLVKDAVTVIEMNYFDTEFNVESIANALHVSHSYLSRVFKENERETLSSRLKNTRLTKAGELLLKTNMTAREIAFSVGYGDDVHFLKEFKKHFGVTTKNYRLERSIYQE